MAGKSKGKRKKDTEEEVEPEEVKDKSSSSKKKKKSKKSKKKSSSSSGSEMESEKEKVVAETPSSKKSKKRKSAPKKSKALPTANTLADEKTETEANQNSVTQLLWNMNDEEASDAEDQPTIAVTNSLLSIFSSSSETGQDVSNPSKEKDGVSKKETSDSQVAPMDENDSLSSMSLSEFLEEKRKKEKEAAERKRKEQQEAAKLAKERKENQDTKSKDNEPRTLFVGNVPVNTSKREILLLFKKFGKIESVRFRSAAFAKLGKPKKIGWITKEFHPERNSCNAYIVFQNIHSVEDAIQSFKNDPDSMVLGENRLRVDGVGEQREKTDHMRTVFVGNVPFNVENEQLREIFASCGTITNIHVVRDRKTGFGVGIAYVTFETKNGMREALLIDGQKIGERELRVSKSRPLSKSNARRGALARAKQRGDYPAPAGSTPSWQGKRAVPGEKPRLQRKRKRKDEAAKKFSKNSKRFAHGKPGKFNRGSRERGGNGHTRGDRPPLKRKKPKHMARKLRQQQEKLKLQQQNGKSS